MFYEIEKELKGKVLTKIENNDVVWDIKRLLLGKC